LLSVDSEKKSGFAGTKWFEMDPEVVARTKERIRQTQLERNSNWKDGSSVEHYHRVAGPKSICSDCGDTASLEVHHIDGNHFDQDPSNLVWLCRRCHMKRDGRIARRDSKGRFVS
jgi:5-methylcytosine-specific restriction endonuclease McrA